MEIVHSPLVYTIRRVAEAGKRRFLVQCVHRNRLKPLVGPAPAPLASAPAPTPVSPSPAPAPVIPPPAPQPVVPPVPNPAFTGITLPSLPPSFAALD